MATPYAAAELGFELVPWILLGITLLIIAALNRMVDIRKEL